MGQTQRSTQMLVRYKHQLERDEYDRQYTPMGGHRVPQLKRKVPNIVCLGFKQRTHGCHYWRVRAQHWLQQHAFDVDDLHSAANGI